MRFNERGLAVANKIQGLAKGHSQIMSEQEDFIKPEIWKILNLFSRMPEEGNRKVKRIKLYFTWS
jgi:hypothetical protein